VRNAQAISRPAVDGKYKTARKKVVSKFTKEQLGQMRLLNRRGNSYSNTAALSGCFFVLLRRVTYKFFTDRSGLPHAHFAMLVSGAGTVSSSHLPLSGMGRGSRAPFSGPWL
jgi:hypothetical protein